MIRTFKIGDQKNIRVKLAVKNHQTFLLLQAVVERNQGQYFWETKHLENYVIMPEEVMEIAPHDLNFYWSLQFTNRKPSRVELVTFDQLDLGEIIYNTYHNYQLQHDKLVQAKEHVETINTWEKALIKDIEDVKEIDFEIKDEDDLLS